MIKTTKLVTAFTLAHSVALIWFEGRAFDLLGPVKPARLGLVGLA